MKTLTKKAIVLASAIVVAGTFAVCAAQVAIDPITPAAGSTSISLTYTLPTTMVDADQVTILAYKGTSADSPTADNIVYIDQMAKSAATGTLTFTMRDGDTFKTGDFRVLMGGTGLDTAGSQTFTLAPAGPTTFTISGKVLEAGVALDTASDPNAADILALLPYASNRGFKINLKSADQTQILKTASVTIEGNNAIYTFTDVAPANYVLQIYRTGAIVRNIPITVGTGNLSVADKSLYVGSSISPDSVNQFDISNIFSLMDSDVWGSTSAAGQGYTALADFDLDGGITPFDLSAVFMNLDKDVDSYGETGAVDTWDTTIE